MRLKRQVVLGRHISLQLVHLRMEHQGNRFMGCDYNIDEVFLSIKGRCHYLRRAVDQDGNG